MKRLLLSTGLVLGLTGAVGCGSLGNSGEYSPQVLNGGAGPFRLAEKVETGINANPVGLGLEVAESIGRTQLTGTAAFYAAAFPLAAPPVRDPALAGWEVDWNQHEARRIFRSTTRLVDADGVPRHAFAAGAPVLSPTETWEVAGVYDPTILALPGGTFRLYYATAQGLGIAESPSLDGTFTRVLTSPIFGDVEGRGPGQSPAVVLLPNGDTMLYLEADGAIWMARSTDGLAFALVDADAATAAIDPLSLPVPVVASSDAGVAPDAGGMDASVATEISVRAPNALTARTATGRFVVRMYFESRRTDGSSVLGVAGSFDGVAFDRSPIVPITKNNPVNPAAFLRDDGITLLTFAITRTGGGVPSTASFLGMTPAERVLPPP
jgi:hypothetical protein